MALNDLFGWLTRTKDDENQPELKSIAREQNDGSLIVTRGHEGDLIGDSWSWSVSLDIDPLIISEQSLITKYREMSLVPEIDKAIEIIINEMVATNADEVVHLDLDRLEYSESLKNKILDEFQHVVNLLDFNNSSYEILRRWYIDGRMQYQVVVDPKTFKEVGIGRLTYLDPRKVKKVRVVKKDKDARTGADTFEEEKGYYLYSEHGFLSTSSTGVDLSMQNSTVRIADDAVVQVTSGLLDPTNSVVLSYLHKAIRPLNQLKALEDATMIYKISRAPERRIFYIDVGNLPPAKAEQVLQKQMNQYRSKMVYDVNTGTVRADPKQMTMIEDYWLPRRSDGRATEITTLPSGNLSGELGELSYFLNKLYNSLNVPITRMDSTNGFNFGKTTEITRDEVILTKFVERLRRRFSNLFLDLLKRQLALKNILNPYEFDQVRQLIKIEYESDNHFDEMLALEVMEARMNMIDRMVNYMAGGQFPVDLFSVEYVYKDILQMSEEQMQDMQKQIAEDRKNMKQNMEEMGVGPDGQPLEQPFEGPNVSQIVHQADSANQVKKAAGAAGDSINSSNTNTEVTQ